MSNVRKTLQMTSLLFGMMILFCYIAWHLGYEGFILVGDISMPMWINKAICVCLFAINYILVLSFSLNEYSRKSFKLIAPFLIFYIFSAYLFPSTIVSGPIALLYIVILGIIRKDFKRTTLRACLCSMLTLIYQTIAISMKSGSLYFDYDISFYTSLTMSIDMIIFTFLIWSIGGVKNEGRSSLEFLVFPGRVRDDRTWDEGHKDDPKSSEDLPVNAFEKWVMRSVIATVQILQWIFILWVCSLDNLFFDALIITTSFICHGMIISNRKHLTPIILCTFAATIMFYISAKLTISFQYSHFFPILVGLLLTYTMYRISYQFDKAVEDKAKEELEKLQKIEAKIDNAWQQIDKLS